MIAAPEIQSVVLTESTDPRSSPEPSNTPENPVAINQNETNPIDNKDQKETLQSKILQLESDAAQKQQRIDELVQEGRTMMN